MSRKMSDYWSYYNNITDEVNDMLDDLPYILEYNSHNSKCFSLFVNLWEQVKYRNIRISNHYRFNNNFTKASQYGNKGYYHRRKMHDY